MSFESEFGSKCFDSSLFCLTLIMYINLSNARINRYMRDISKTERCVEPGRSPMAYQHSNIAIHINVTWRSSATQAGYYSRIVCEQVSEYILCISLVNYSHKRFVSHAPLLIALFLLPILHLLVKRWFETNFLPRFDQSPPVAGFCRTGEISLAESFHTVISDSLCLLGVCEEVVHGGG